MFDHLSHILLDAARLPGKIQEAKVRNHAYDSLYRGGVEAEPSGVGPYIFRFAFYTPFANWVMKTGWGSAWGVFLKSSWALPELHTHFRKFLLVQDDQYRQLYLRYYDPRVLRVFLPSCDAAQIRAFFGEAIDYFIVEDETPAYALRYWHENGILKIERFAADGIMALLPDPEPMLDPEPDKLLPETIAALKEQGMLAQVLAVSSANIKEHHEGSAERKSPPAPLPELHTALEAESGDPKTKRKWRLFE